MERASFNRCRMRSTPIRVLIALPILAQFPNQGAYCVRAQMEGAAQDIVVRFQVANALMVVPPGAPGQSAICQSDGMPSRNSTERW